MRTEVEGQVPPSLLPPAQPAIVPAHVGFVAIYNPNLGAGGEDDLEDQILYYSAIDPGVGKSRRRRYGDKKPSKASKTSTGISVYSRHGSASTKGKSDVEVGSSHVREEHEKNERLRQIGLIQGMVEFSKGFSLGEPLEMIETERNRAVVHELEVGWWIVASIDLTRLPLRIKPEDGSASSSSKSKLDAEYSSREVKPAALLLADLQRAHRIFIMHHAASLSALWEKLNGGPQSNLKNSSKGRYKFMSLLERYWDKFLVTWSVIMHGNPIRDVFGGIRIAASGELGVGVGEEERGSGERDVLEGLVGNVEGLVDLVVGRFGDDLIQSHDGRGKKPSWKQRNAQTDGQEENPWLGTGAEPGPEDGAVFLGVGALSRGSLKDLTYWMEDLYTWGENAYGVSENPLSTRKARARQKRVELTPGDTGFPSSALAPPPLPTRASSESTLKPTSTGKDENLTAVLETDQAIGTTHNDNDQPRVPEAQKDAATVDKGKNVQGEDSISVNKLVSYLKLGYGTYWSLPGSESSTLMDESPPEEAPDSRRSEASGRYLIGLLGRLESNHAAADWSLAAEHENIDVRQEVSNTRIIVRTLNLEMNPNHHQESSTIYAQDNHDAIDRDSSPPHSEYPNHGKLRVLVYVAKPFIYVLLFHIKTASLAWDTLYRTLHSQLVPLRRGLLLSTNYRPERPLDGRISGKPKNKKPRIYDLVYDVENMTTHCTIPSIPEVGTKEATTAHGTTNQSHNWFVGDEEEEDNSRVPWSRTEAVNTHMQLLNIRKNTIKDHSQLERTAKTNRGWWIVWSRIVERNSNTASAAAATATAEMTSTSTEFSTSTGMSCSMENPEGASAFGHEGEETSSQDGSVLRSGKNDVPRLGSVDGEEEDGNAMAAWVVGAVRPADTVKKEIFLIRKAGETMTAERKGMIETSTLKSSSRLGGGGWGGDGSAMRLAQGIGVDTNRYIEGLLRLDR